jgi:hypothetical protein
MRSFIQIAEHPFLPTPLKRQQDCKISSAGWRGEGRACAPFPFRLGCYSCCCCCCRVGSAGCRGSRGCSAAVKALALAEKARAKVLRPGAALAGEPAAATRRGGGGADGHAARAPAREPQQVKELVRAPPGGALELVAGVDSAWVSRRGSAGASASAALLALLLYKHLAQLRHDHLTHLRLEGLGEGKLLVRGRGRGGGSSSSGSSGSSGARGTSRRPTPTPTTCTARAAAKVAPSSIGTVAASAAAPVAVRGERKGRGGGARARRRRGAPRGRALIGARARAPLGLRRPLGATAAAVVVGKVAVTRRNALRQVQLVLGAALVLPHHAVRVAHQKGLARARVPPHFFFCPSLAQGAKRGDG